jgi:bifunctional lysine-specific demethylase and histidyl-hydroxylase NO66
VTLDTAERVRAGRGALARCAPDPDAFLRDTWGRRAAVVARRDPTGFDDLLSLDDVDRFLTTTALRTPFFRLVKAGERIDERSYTRSGRTGSRDVAGIADPARVAALFEDGATIVLQGLHRWSEPVARFCRDLELDLGHPCQVNAYVTPAGAQGLDLHEDPHDVLVLQAFGRKRWEIHAAPREARGPIDAEVEPGDTIYLPKGTPHAARAQDVLSGHLTVGIHVTPWRDVVSSVVAELLAEDDDVPAGWTAHLPAFADDLKLRLAALADRIDEVDAVAVAERRRERFLSTRAQLARGTIAERSEAIRAHDSTVVRRRRGTVCEVRARRGLLVVLLGDRRLEMPAWLEAGMRRIAAMGEGEPIAVRDLAPDVPDAGARAVLVQRLIREGLLTAR